MGAIEKESDKAKIDVKSIKEVRTGKNTDTFRTNGSSDHISEDCAFSIIYGENYESLDLVANSADVANIWVTGLRYLISYGKHTLNMIQSSQDNMRASWLGDLFDEADVIGGKCISLCSAVQLIKKLSPGVKNVKIELKFKELHKAKDKIGSDVTKEEFIEVFSRPLHETRNLFFIGPVLKQQGISWHQGLDDLFGGRAGHGQGERRHQCGNYSEVWILEGGATQGMALPGWVYQLPHVSRLPHLWSGTKNSMPRHEPTPFSLLHKLFPQYLPDWGPVQGSVRHYGLHPCPKDGLQECGTWCVGRAR